MGFQYLLTENRDGVCVITLNRPQAYNAVNLDMLPELEQCLEECAGDQTVAVVILTGAGSAFCSGGDIAEFASDPRGAPFVTHELTKYLNRTIIELRRMPQPVIACINGAVGGAGISLAAACDLRIASSTAKFRQGYTGIGLVPDGAWTLTIPLLIGWGKACELILLNPVFGAEEAREWGLVNRVVPPERLQEETWEVARSLAEGPRQAFSIAKHNLNLALMAGLELQLEEDRRGIVAAARTDDSREGFRAFLEKRKPRFNR